MKLRNSVPSILCILALTSSASQAGVWNEAGDAVDLLPGQETLGIGTLDAINGTLGVNGDVDLYKIIITNPAAFSASTVGATSLDSQLFLFSATGLGVTFNDDLPGGIDVRQSRITGTFVLSPGVYYLAISSFDTDPLGGTPLAEIWLDEPFDTERAPDGPSAAALLAGWDRDPFSDVGGYTINLTGAAFAATPEPGTALLIAVGAVLAVRRRRK